MKISQSNNNLSFQKTLKAKAAVLKNKEQLPCNIYRLDDGDEDYFVRLNYKWVGEFTEVVKDLIYAESLDNIDVYVLENEKEECLGYITPEDRGPRTNIHYLEVSPKDRFSHKKRNIEYVGETLIAFLSKIAQKKDKTLMVEMPLHSAIEFYTRKCHFNKALTSSDYPLYLSKEDRDILIKQNKDHTGKEVELV